MNTIQIKDKTFTVSIPEPEITRQVRRVAGEINRDMAGLEPIFLVILNGAFVFAADLLREITLPAQVRFVRVSSYEGMSTTGKVRELIGLDVDIEGRDVVIVEDIVDSGLTMKHVTEMLSARQPHSLSVCTLLFKPDNLSVKLDIRYTCFEMPNDFLVGYGLDYDGYGRNLRDIYTVVE